MMDKKSENKFEKEKYTKDLKKRISLNEDLIKLSKKYPDKCFFVCDRNMTVQELFSRMR